jgi:hypothetical protein
MNYLVSNQVCPKNGANPTKKPYQNSHRTGHHRTHHPNRGHTHLVVHPTNRVGRLVHPTCKWINRTNIPFITKVYQGYKLLIKWGYNLLMIRGMNHQVPINYQVYKL